MEMKVTGLTGSSLTAVNSVDLVLNNAKISLTKDALKKVRASRKLVDNWISKDEIIYGITTGFGEFKDVRISSKDLEELQRNLILRSLRYSVQDQQNLPLSANCRNRKTDS